MKPKREKTCPNCKEKFRPFNTFQAYCLKNECIKAWNDSKRKSVKRKAKIEFNHTDKKWLKNQARKNCHEYIRLRDKDLPCVSCGCYYNELNYQQAGHFKNDGNHAMVRYHEDNIHGQCVRCNMHKSGEEKPYEVEIRKRIGDERVDHILAVAFDVKDYTIEELKEIAEKYKRMTKELDVQS